MHGVDTNVLVRLVTQDDGRQASIVDDLIGRAVAQGDKLLINSVVLCELVWVLRRAYGYVRDEIVPVRTPTDSSPAESRMCSTFGQRS